MQRPPADNNVRHNCLSCERARGSRPETLSSVDRAWCCESAPSRRCRYFDAERQIRHTPLRLQSARNHCNSFDFMKVNILPCATATAHELLCKVGVWITGCGKNREG